MPLGCLQDLQRFLRRDDTETKSIHLQLGSWNLVSNQLLPILASHRDNFEIIYEVCAYLLIQSW